MRTEVRLEEHPDKQHTEHKQHHSKSDQRHSSGPEKIQEAQGDPEAELEALQGGPLKIPVYIWTRELVNSCIQWTVGPPLALGLRGTESPRPVCGSLGPSGGPMPLCFGGAMPGRVGIGLPAITYLRPPRLRGRLGMVPFCGLLGYTKGWGVCPRPYPPHRWTRGCLVPL